MANVHGFRDGNNENNNRGGPNQGQYQNLEPAVGDEIPFMNPMKGDQRPPMDETIPYTLRIICCPDIKILSTTAFYLLAIWILYIVCLIKGLTEQNHQVLEVSATVLIDFGAALGTLIQKGQIYRLLLASFLHVSLLHIMMNTISLLIFLTRFQKLYPKLAPVVLLVSSITGFMLSVLCDKSVATVGASTAIFGVLGGFVAYLIINWTALQRYGHVRSTLCCVIGILVVFSLLFSIGSSIDSIAHLGGLVGGVMISLAILPGMVQKSRILTIIGTCGIVGMNLITFLVFFLTD